MLEPLDRYRLETLKKASLNCTKCHGRDEECECYKALTLESRKIDAKIPIEYREFNFSKIKDPLMKPILQSLKSYVEKIAKNGMGQGIDSLYFYSGSGTGKTAVGCVVLMKLLEIGYNCYYTTPQNYINIVSSRDENFDLGVIKDTTFLLLDNVGSEYRDKNNYILSSLEELLEYRASKLTPTIITSTTAPTTTFHDSIRITSKIKQYYMVYNFKGKDHRAKIKEEKFTSEENKILEEEKAIAKENPSGSQ